MKIPFNFLCDSCHQLSKAVNSCYQLLTAGDSCYKKKFKWDFHLLPKAKTCTKFQLSRLLGGLAREYDGRTYARTYARTHVRTPGENSANSGPAGLVPRPEFSKYEVYAFIGLK